MAGIWRIYFALGYEVSGLGRRIALFLVKFMGKRTLTLGYAIVIIDILLAPFTPSNTARTGGTVFPVIKNLPPLFKSLATMSMIFLRTTCSGHLESVFM